MEYKILEAGNIDSLEKQVNGWIFKGWQVQGGVSTITPGQFSQRTYVQAMTKIEQQTVYHYQS